MDDHPKQWFDQAAPEKGYALSGKIMLSAIVVLFAVVVFMVGLHLYARWYLLCVRRRQLERRRQRRASRSQVLLMADGRHVQITSVADRGLDLAVLNSLPMFTYSSKAELPPLTECAVCLSEFEEAEAVRLLPKCNHSFHIDCIDMWFHSHSTCPLCRSPVEKVEGTAFRPLPDKPNSSKSNCSLPPPVWDRRKGLELVGVRIEVPPRAMPENELSQNSPASSRLSALKRILSMGRKSPAAGGTPTPRGAGPSRLVSESDPESGQGEWRQGGESTSEEATA